ncbi:hypothetical protein OS493_024265 [Desmophyllum pertusum]|uniref:Uncharacterized protein n=1 Tax=Desmophyllum pertusum TaxID=174260 RepID=A0A9W9Z1N9_9CNID|nr:hypothetical protein OS493_024265 [Desmophyllum pertusum]
MKICICTSRTNCRPERKPLVVVGQNLTLRCNASGADPRPNITWTKDGIPGNQFNVSGGLLNLVRVQRKDLGSYRCTASNGYGSNATSVSIVSMQCNNDVCEVKKVGLTIVSEEWKEAYSNKASVEFKTMESRVLAAVWGTYTNNLEKQLYHVTVGTFRSGSVVATLEMKFGKSVNTLEEAIRDGKLGSFTVDPVLDLNPTVPSTIVSTASTSVVTAVPSTIVTTASTSVVTDE